MIVADKELALVDLEPTEPVEALEPSLLEMIGGGSGSLNGI